MPVLTPEQLTGRVSTHVLKVPQLSCSLHAEAARAFLALVRHAAHDGIDLMPASSFRPFSRQLTIWNAKFHGRSPLLDRDGHVLDIARLDEQQIVRAILLWSALPGASRHHWGTEVDVYDRAALPPPQQPRLLPQEYAPDGIFGPLSAWLERHGAGHGFFRPYDSDRGGVLPEPWHLSFAPVASTALPALTVEVLADALHAGEAAGELAGAGVVRRLLPEIHERYVCRVAAPGAASRATRPS